MGFVVSTLIPAVTPFLFNLLAIGLVFVDPDWGSGSFNSFLYLAIRFYSQTPLVPWSDRDNFSRGRTMLALFVGGFEGRSFELAFSHCLLFIVVEPPNERDEVGYLGFLNHQDQIIILSLNQHYLNLDHRFDK